MTKDLQKTPEKNTYKLPMQKSAATYSTLPCPDRMGNEVSYYVTGLKNILWLP